MVENLKILSAWIEYYKQWRLLNDHGWSSYADNFKRSADIEFCSTFHTKVIQKTICICSIFLSHCSVIRITTVTIRLHRSMGEIIVRCVTRKSSFCSQANSFIGKYSIRLYFVHSIYYIPKTSSALRWICPIKASKVGWIWSGPFICLSFS